MRAARSCLTSPLACQTSAEEQLIAMLN